VFILLVDKLKVSELSLLFADLGWLLILDIVCTAFSFVLRVQLVKKIPPNSFVMAVNLEQILRNIAGPADLSREWDHVGRILSGGGDCCPDDYSQRLLSEEEMVFRHWLC
jgi:hypothetical protein